jgi:hypothetical protein
MLYLEVKISSSRSQARSDEARQEEEAANSNTI